MICLVADTGLVRHVAVPVTHKIGDRTAWYVALCGFPDSDRWVAFDTDEPDVAALPWCMSCALAATEAHSLTAAGEEATPE